VRDPARIARLISMLHVYWISHRDLRLGQIVCNLTPDRFDVMTQDGFLKADPYNVEDDVWEEIFRKALKSVQADQ
jgi:hypothetical protein